MGMIEKELNFILKAKFNLLKGFKQTRTIIRFVAT